MPRMMMKKRKLLYYNYIIPALWSQQFVVLLIIISQLQFLSLCKSLAYLLLYSLICLSLLLRSCYWNQKLLRTALTEIIYIGFFCCSHLQKTYRWVGTSLLFLPFMEHRNYLYYFSISNCPNQLNKTEVIYVCFFTQWQSRDCFYSVSFFFAFGALFGQFANFDLPSSVLTEVVFALIFQFYFHNKL